MSDPQNNLPSTTEAKAGSGDSEPAGGKSWASWAVGWVLLPSTVIGVLFGSGALLGAHMPDSWFSRLVVWFVELWS